MKTSAYVANSDQNGKRSVGWPLIVSALLGAVTLASGSGFVFPVESAASGVCDLTAIASGMLFFGLPDGE
jgi:hypothetical protein